MIFFRHFAHMAAQYPTTPPFKPIHLPQNTPHNKLDYFGFSFITKVAEIENEVRFIKQCILVF